MHLRQELEGGEAMTRTLTNADETRAHMETVSRDVAAFATPDGSHVLVHIDDDGGIGLVDPAARRSWSYLSRLSYCWPLVPLADHTSAAVDRLQIAAQDAAAILRVRRPLTRADIDRAAEILSRALDAAKGERS